MIFFVILNKQTMCSGNSNETEKKAQKQIAEHLPEFKYHHLREMKTM